MDGVIIVVVLVVVHFVDDVDDGETGFNDWVLDNVDVDELLQLMSLILGNRVVDDDSVDEDDEFFNIDFTGGVVVIVLLVDVIGLDGDGSLFLSVLIDLVDDLLDLNILGMILFVIDDDDDDESLVLVVVLLVGWLPAETDWDLDLIPGLVTAANLANTSSIDDFDVDVDELELFDDDDGESVVDDLDDDGLVGVVLVGVVFVGVDVLGGINIDPLDTDTDRDFNLVSRSDIVCEVTFIFANEAAVCLICILSSIKLLLLLLALDPINADDVDLLILLLLLLLVVDDVVFFVDENDELLLPPLLLLLVLVGVVNDSFGFLKPGLILGLSLFFFVGVFPVDDVVVVVVVVLLLLLLNPLSLLELLVIGSSFDCGLLLLLLLLFGESIKSPVALNVGAEDKHTLLRAAIRCDSDDFILFKSWLWVSMTLLCNDVEVIIIL